MGGAQRCLLRRDFHIPSDNLVPCIFVIKWTKSIWLKFKGTSHAIKLLCNEMYTPPQIPNLNRAILWTRIHPITITLEPNCHYIIGMRIIAHYLPHNQEHKLFGARNKQFFQESVSVEKTYRLRATWVNIKQPYVRITGCSQVAFIRGYLQPVYLLHKLDTAKLVPHYGT